ncbi:hypothetical protein [Microbacterium sp. KSW4-4]|uniref:hypothetical protein n=1 Tax=Microbacterium sp. KSW4-4 TaxID=2851651 RepID=UPI001FFC6F62|nr:hypothetical protein [Microbacterium sp. KSW4-4]MCK2034451.1 hypothetical protein [Microbacterium sp. KSW4-4]
MSMTASEAAAWREDVNELHGVLMNAAQERSDRSSFLPVSGELGWVVFERLAMLDAVNRLRARKGRSPVDRERIEFAERRAVGHSDYMLKFAMGAADLVSSP